MSDLYSSEHLERGDLSLPPLGVPSADITVTSRPFDGECWYTIAQQSKEAIVAIAVSGEELDQLISVLQQARARVRKDNDPAPVQLTLFDPDNPPEAPSDPRLDTA